MNSLESVRIAELVKFAYDAANWYYPFGKDKERTPGDQDSYIAFVNVRGKDHRCVFSFTVSPGDNAVFRDLSISVRRGYPSIEDLTYIAEKFGFTGGPGDWLMHTYGPEEGNYNCVRICSKEHDLP